MKLSGFLCLLFIVISQNTSAFSSSAFIRSSFTRSTTTHSTSPFAVTKPPIIEKPVKVNQRFSTFHIWLQAETAHGTMAEGSERTVKLIIAGAPASGKGTQCEVIKEKYGVVHLSTGDMLRAAVAAGTDVGKKAKDFMDSGKLVPDDVIIGVVKDRLLEPDCVKQGWLLDGFPRTSAQASALSDAGIKADCFIFLNVPDSVLVERVVGRRTDPETGKIYHMTFSPPESEEVKARLVQRSDDTEEKVKVRLEQFHSNVEAVKDSFSDIMVVVDGNKAPDSVTTDIVSAIDDKLKNKLASA
ncbi:hypothetical protein ACA910_010676 [Epithemia clementina (nom. ined.)]